MKEVVKIRNLSFSYPQNGFQLREVNLTISEGEMVGLIGPNGSGKTTLLKLISGVMKNYSGSIKIGGMEIRRLSKKKLARLVSYVPQEFDPLFNYSVETIVSMGRIPYMKPFRSFSEEDVRMVVESMKVTDVLRFRTRGVRDISGGERRRVTIARAFAQGTPVVLLDEFLSHLDLGHVRDIMGIMLSKLKNEKITIIAAFHEVNLASLMCDKLVGIKDGRIIFQGAPQETLNEENIFTLYGIRPVLVVHPRFGKPQVLIT